MKNVNLKVSEIRNAGFGDFRAVSAMVEGKEYGADAYLDADEVITEIQDWEDGNGLIACRHATARDVREAVLAAAMGLGANPQSLLTIAEDLIEAGNLNCEAAATSRPTKEGIDRGVQITNVGVEQRSFFDEESLRAYLAEVAA